MIVGGVIWALTMKCLLIKFCLLPFSLNNKIIHNIIFGYLDSF